MLNKLKQAEILLSQILVRQKELTGENAALKNKMRSLEQDRAQVKELQGQVRELKEWKKNTQHTLRKLLARIEKELEKSQAQNNKIV